jgi:pimeloyl-ACP methyl ester carboxylesterase
MCRSMKLSMLFVLLIVALTACAPAATPVPPTATNPPPTNTPVPPPTYTPVPSPTVTPKPTPSAVKGKFDAGGVNLYITCSGDGSPTVVFDAGWGETSSVWTKIMLDLRSHTRVCAYDRASMGQSNKQPGLRTSGQIAEQLHTLLGNAGVEGPYIPVGHSVGGMNMLVFANRYPSEVAGLVLVNSSHPDQNDRLLAALPTPSPGESKVLAYLRKESFWTNPADQSFPEPMNWTETLAQVRAVKSLGSLPLAVLIAVDPSKSNWGDLPPELAASFDKIGWDLLKEYAKLSTDSSLILAERSGHYIQNDEPQLVIDAILGLVDKARQK